MLRKSIATLGTLLALMAALPAHAEGLVAWERAVSELRMLTTGATALTDSTRLLAAAGNADVISFMSAVQSGDADAVALLHANPGLEYALQSVQYTQARLAAAAILGDPGAEGPERVVNGCATRGNLKTLAGLCDDLSDATLIGAPVAKWRSPTTAVAGDTFPYILIWAGVATAAIAAVGVYDYADPSRRETLLLSIGIKGIEQWQLGDREGALKTMRYLVEQKPEVPKYKAWEAFLLDELDRPHEAAAAAQLALDLHAHRPADLDELDRLPGKDVQRLELIASGYL